MSFHTLLVANRSEIALRVIRAARALGLRTVAVFSDADAALAHVAEADLAVRLGPAPAQDSYRNIAAILRACRSSGAQAVHPGYGFLAENAEFARAVTDAGLVFVGPSAEVIDLMGNKARAKAAMREADVPTVPGWQGEANDDAMRRHARDIGYPVILKAAAGGGGRGMRLAHDDAALAAALPAARSEALSAFGSDELILEKAVESARHIEIQVLCDRHGNCVHLGERDCSTQRRYQKVIEECPSPAVSPLLRERMGALAVRACRRIGYEGVGTLEFLLAGDDFYFMEMNTRLQVEHGVTELVTGIDLVQWQLRVALGEALGFSQQDVRWSGHAIEVRLCAEDPAAGFMPQVGTVARWQAPADVRVDTALADGVQITPHYDSMLAKLMAWAPSRGECVRRMILACEHTTLLGVRSNLGFLRKALAHPVFAAGGVTTTFLADEDLDGPLWRSRPDAHVEAAAALALSGWRTGSGLAAPADIALDEDAPDAVRTLRLATDGPRLRLCAEAADGSRREALATVIPTPTPDACTLRIDEVQRRVRVACVADTAWVQVDADVWRYRRQPLADIDALDEPGAVVALRAPLSGKVASVHLQAGAEVARSEPVMVLESMKMEMPIPANASGRVLRVAVAAGEQVSTGQILMEIQR